MSMGHNHDNLTAAYIENAVVIRIEGRGSFKISPPLKQFIHQVINSNPTTQILLDMSECVGMDSTFMGVLAGISCYIKSKEELQFKLINLSGKNQKLLITLGIDRIINYSLSTTAEEKTLMTHPVEKHQTLEPDLSDKLEAAQTSLLAHEALVNAHPENYARFKSVLEYLQNDVDALNHR